MKITITYETNKTKEQRTKVFIRDDVNQAISFFNWRYGHKIISVGSV